MEELEILNSEMQQALSGLLSKAEKDIREFTKDLPFVTTSEVSVPHLDHHDVMYALINMKYVEIMDKFYHAYGCDDKDVICKLNGLVKMILRRIFVR